MRTYEHSHRPHQPTHVSFYKAAYVCFYCSNGAFDSLVIIACQLNVSARRMSEWPKHPWQTRGRKMMFYVCFVNRFAHDAVQIRREKYEI